MVELDGKPKWLPLICLVSRLYADRPRCTGSNWWSKSCLLFCNLVTECENRRWCFHNGSCYWISKNSGSSFSSARDACTQRDAHLAEIQTPDENTFVGSLTTEQTVLLIGYHKKHAGKWVWTNTNAAGTFTNWDPSGDHGFHCAGLQTDKKNFPWTTLGCDSRWKYVCEKGTVIWDGFLAVLVFWQFFFWLMSFMHGLSVTWTAKQNFAQRRAFSKGCSSRLELSLCCGIVKCVYWERALECNLFPQINECTKQFPRETNLSTLTWQGSTIASVSHPGVPHKAHFSSMCLRQCLHRTVEGRQASTVCALFSVNKTRKLLLGVRLRPLKNTTMLMFKSQNSSAIWTDRSWCGSFQQKHRSFCDGTA